MLRAVLTLVVSRGALCREPSSPVVVMSEFDLPLTRFGHTHKSPPDDKSLTAFRLRLEFDWWSADGGDRGNRAMRPRTIFAVPREAYTILGQLQELGPPAEDRSQRPILVLGGDDKPHVSEWKTQAVLKKLLEYVAWVRHEANDERFDYVGTSVCGLWELYYRSYEDVMFQTVNSASLDTKKGLVMGAWSHFWSNLDDKISSRAEISAWIETVDFVNRTGVPTSEWYPTIASFKYLLAPLGNGIQTPKVVESLMVLTIPIVQRVTAYEDLYREGWPFLMVDHWSDITQECLEEKWPILAPKVEAFRHTLFGRGLFNYLTSPPILGPFDGDFITC